MRAVVRTRREIVDGEMCESEVMSVCGGGGGEMRCGERMEYLLKMEIKI
jgi:hypothetical protein